MLRRAKFLFQRTLSFIFNFGTRCLCQKPMTIGQSHNENRKIFSSSSVWRLLFFFRFVSSLFAAEIDEPPSSWMFNGLSIYCALTRICCNDCYWHVYRVRYIKKYILKYYTDTFLNGTISPFSSRYTFVCSWRHLDVEIILMDHFSFGSMFLVYALVVADSANYRSAECCIVAVRHYGSM